MASRKLGEILLDAGVIDEFQLRSALGEQQRWGQRLGLTLIKSGFLEERDLVRALAQQFKLPVAHLEGKRIDKSVLELVPVGTAERHMILPLFVKDADGQRTLYLGMEDPSDLQVLDDLRFRAGMQVRPVLMGPSEICEGIDRFYRKSGAADEGMLRELSDEEEAPPAAVAVAPAREEVLDLTEGPVAPPPPEETPRIETREIALALRDLLVEKGILQRGELEQRVLRNRRGE